MHIEHVALWTTNLERCIEFYRRYFGATPGTRYVNAKKGFESAFLQFSSGARLEVMQTSSLTPIELEAGAQRMGLTHLAITVGSDSRVDELTRELGSAGHAVLDGPRRTGDGYYESVVLDPDGNRIEITG
jgi:lactoylglutathione lyase